ncbi:DUF4129 domain-containing protein [Agromyces intestinalis]|uniref:DUF4129 domain-containing protein n=1 Tax=Agromyces intestinalis TaxID=2592652 RepID=A0A5C1YFG7_9MICO|nr:DUF4129 domain-containing protein [Agromyces intestinalis]QEO13502.1 DUF4129 domain-containing protein [Agromyces intestinalis]
MHLEIPVDPDAPEARRWLQDELAKGEYQAAQPTWFDRLMAAIRDWFLGLFDGSMGVPSGVVVLIVVLAVLALVAIGLLVFGLPRLRRRRATPAPIFDDRDTRDLVALRRAAEQAAARQEWPLAIEERFRAVVRGLVDRDLVQVHPGTTAHGIANAASHRFPAFALELGVAADEFDGVRYLGRPGGRDEYKRVTALEQSLAAAPIRPDVELEAVR